jgi:hypothetical protein
VVNLTGADIAKAGTATMQQISAQLFSTLTEAGQSGSSGQVAQSVEVMLNGKLWGGQGNTVQRSSTWHPASVTGNTMYYVSSAGELTSRTTPGGKPTAIERIGPGFTQIAVSATGTYLAALNHGTLYTGLVGGQLTKRGTGYVAMSWDASDELWASQGMQINIFRNAQSSGTLRGGQHAQQQLNQVVQVQVPLLIEPITALQVAPDGVRVAIVMGGNELTFGAISHRQSQNPVVTLSLVQVQPLQNNGKFTALTWYNPDNVIALAEPGPSVTLYPVSGGTPTPIEAYPGMNTITSSSAGQLIAGLGNGHMVFDAGLTGSWGLVNDGDTPASGSSPTYAGLTQP